VSIEKCEACNGSRYDGNSARLCQPCLGRGWTGEFKCQICCRPSTQLFGWLNGLGVYACTRCGTMYIPEVMV